MRRVVFLLEEYSMKALLESLLPRLYPDLIFLCVSHEGKQDLERSIPRKLRAWNEPGVRFCVIRDNDGEDCRNVKRRLAEACGGAGKPETLVRIACQELEAWYFGDLAAVARAFERDESSFEALGAKRRFRDPDAIDQPSRVLTELVEEFQKVSGARRVGQQLTRNSRSVSFLALLSGLDRLQLELSQQEDTA